MGASTLKQITLTALVAAICVIGSFIKIPGFMASAALDSAPALISVVFLPPLYSGFASGIGHLATALTSGFPSGPFHLLIAFEMVIITYIFNVLHSYGFNMLKWVFFIIGNGVLAALPFYYLISPAFFIGAVPNLVIASVINAALAAMALPIMEKVNLKGKVSKI